VRRNAADTNLRCIIKLSSSSGSFSPDVELQGTSETSRRQTCSDEEKKNLINPRLTASNLSF